MKLFYNPSGTVKVLPVSVLPVNAVWNGGFPYTPEGSLLVSIVSAKPTDTVSNGGFIQELWGGVCAGYDTPSIWIGGLAITSYGALCLDVDGGIVTDGPALYNSLTHTAIPTRGDITPSFTRATTSTWPNNDGYMVTGVAGEARFVGARRVRNLVNTTSEDFSNAAWTKTLSTVTSGFTDPNGGTGAYRLQSTGAGGYLEQVIATTKIPIASAAVMAWYIKSNTAASQTVKFARFTSVEAKTVTTSWQRLEHFTASAGGSNFYIQDTGGNNLDVLIYRCQIEDVTAQTTQTAGEYVSVGVESAPYYHGSFVDGVACFDYYYLD